MGEKSSVLHHLSDPDLIAEVTRLATLERKAIAELVSALAELDSRRLYLGQGCSSMFTYCTQVLHLSEHAAFNRIEAARAARRFPIILELLADGRIHLSAVRLLAPHLTAANHESVLREASHKSKREVEQIVARLLPRSDAPSIVRKLPKTATTPKITSRAPTIETSAAPPDVGPVALASAPRPKTEPLAPGRFKVQLTVGEETYRKLRRVQDLLRHQLPNGDLEKIIDRAFTLLLAELEKSKFAATKQPRVSSLSAKCSRHVPSHVRRVVWARDGGRCRFEGSAGRCTETGLLEFHHVIPYAHGGPTTVENLQLRCAAHNRYEAEQCFGLFVREVAQSYTSDTVTRVQARATPRDRDWRSTIRFDDASVRSPFVTIGTAGEAFRSSRSVETRRVSIPDVGGSAGRGARVPAREPQCDPGGDPDPARANGLDPAAP